MTTAAATDDRESPLAPTTGPLPNSTVRWYGMGQAAEGIKNYAFASCLLFYYTSVLGLSGALAGVALMIALAFDAVTDPMVAVLSDRTRSRWGRRHPYLFLSAAPLGLFFYLVFVPPENLAATLHVDEQWALFGWLLGFAVLTRAAMTLFHVPHMALGAELSDDFDERTRVVTARSIASLIGTTLVVTGYFVLLAAMQSSEYPDVRLNPLPYGYFAALFAAIIVLTVFGSAWGTRDRIPLLREPDVIGRGRGILASMFGDMREALSLASFRALFFGFTLCYLGFGVTTALGTHNALYFWHISIETQGLLGITLVFGSLGGMAFWKKVAERTDKKPTFLAGLACFTTFSAPPMLLEGARSFSRRGRAALHSRADGDQLPVLVRDRGRDGGGRIDDGRHHGRGRAEVRSAAGRNLLWCVVVRDEGRRRARDRDRGSRLRFRRPLPGAGPGRGAAGDRADARPDLGWAHPRAGRLLVHRLHALRPDARAPCRDSRAHRCSRRTRSPK